MKLLKVTIGLQHRGLLILNKVRWRNGRRLDLYKNRSYVMNYDTKCMGVFHLQYNTGSNPVLTTKIK